MPKHYLCHDCGHEFILNNERLPYINERNESICDSCCRDRSQKFNKPTHYHMHDMDTITFLQKGFPPEVCMGFLLGNVIKYSQRANYKNGLDDFEKMVDYAKRALDWYLKSTEKS